MSLTNTEVQIHLVGASSTVAAALDISLAHLLTLYLLRLIPPQPPSQSLRAPIRQSNRHPLAEVKVQRDLRVMKVLTTTSGLSPQILKSFPDCTLPKFGNH